MLRWNVELDFRSIKTYMKLKFLRAKKNSHGSLGIIF
jgi:hypothetical protein